ncbi:hypothetical protein NX059_000075 [Plenodomus lindquistii]|nr:hypothetical protein NX059_000075 [Plenodomus lindquistii]
MTEQNLFDMIPAETPTMSSPPPPKPGFLGVDINLHATYNTCYFAMHYFRLPRDTRDIFKPAIILIASIAGYVGYPSSRTYSTSKFGVRGLFYGIRDRGIRCSPPVRINLVAPWYIKTAMTLTANFMTSEAGLLLDVMGFVPMDRVVDAVERFSVDQSLLEELPAYSQLRMRTLEMISKALATEKFCRNTWAMSWCMSSSI